MQVKQFLIHRLRDVDAVLRGEKKIKPFIYIVLRSLIKPLKIKEEKLKSLIQDNISHLYGLQFFTRKNSIDFIFCSKYYEIETTRYLRSMQGKMFINVGGHIGRFALLASRNFQHIYVFEPQPSNFRTLENNIHLNSITNITAVNAAVSDKVGIVTLSNLNSNTGWVYISDTGQIKARCTSLDYFVENLSSLNVKDIDMVMIDAEGHELEVLMGGASIFKEGNPLILLESFEVEKIGEILKVYGYKKILTLDSYNHLFKKL